VTRKIAIALALVFGCAGVLVAQRYGGRGRGGGWGWGGGEGIPENSPMRTAREAQRHSNADFPSWTNAPGFEKDVWTFARVRYKRAWNGYSRGNCFTDCPDSDLNFSFRLHQMTSLQVDPDGRIINLTDPDLSEFPWIYMVEPGGLRLEEEEVVALRKHLLNGGFLMADDFWGSYQWQNFEDEMKRVFPDRKFVELPMDHPIFNCVFDLSKKQKNELQTPNYRTGEMSQYPPHITWEYHQGEECIDVHIRALFDDKGRMMVIACHNTDDGDGWEREQEYQYFFREFSEKRAYPLGINIIFYAMTH
jgi:hypothetical protein